MIRARSTAGLLSVLVFCALPAVASAQAWLEAYQAGEYAKAADLLHDIVSEPEHLLRQPDPAPLRLLAQLYAEGRGVPRDPVAACSLAQDAEMSTQMAPWKHPMVTMDDARAYDAWLKEARDFAAGYCDGLSQADLRTASVSRGGCYGFGMAEDVMSVGGERVRVSRAGIVPAGTPETDMGGFMCPLVVAQVRRRTIAAPDDAAPSVQPRHFIEVFAWRRSGNLESGTGKYTLSWQVFEMREKAVAWVVLLDVPVAASVSPRGFPPDVDARLTLEMIRSGHVLWRLDGAPPRRGWLMLPEGKASR